MLELGGSGQGCLGGVEGLLHQRRPSQGLARTLKCVGQREEKTSSASQKPAVEVHEAKETLKFEACQQRGNWTTASTWPGSRQILEAKTRCPKSFTSSWPKTDFCGLMVRPFSRKHRKSAPKIGQSTVANVEFQSNLWVPPGSRREGEGNCALARTRN